MGKFEKGDVVIRTGHSYSDGRVIKGNTYIVHSIPDKYRLRLEGVFNEVGYLDWFDKNEFELVEKKQPTSYREMNPDSTVKVKIGDYEFDCPIKELLIIDVLSGNIVGEPRTSTFFYNIEKALDTDSLSLIGLCSNDVSILNSEDFYQEYFKPFYDKQEDKDLLLKDIEEQKTILKNQEEFLKELEDKYNSL